MTLTLLGFIGVWSESMTTLSLVLTAVFFCAVIGIPLGILCARSDRLERVVRPLLDAMQTLPALVRLTNLGIRQVPEDKIEAARAFGGTPWQMLKRVQLPLATSTIMAGLNQTLMLSLWIAGVLVEDRDVVWLEVPRTDLPGGKNDVDTMYKGKNLGFAVDKVEAVLNRDFAEKNPAALKFLSEMQITTADESAQNLKMQQGENKPADIRRYSEQWVAAHRAQFDQWLQAARDAAK